MSNAIQVWPLERIKPYEKNAKVHDDKQVEKIAESIKRYGWRGNPIVVDEDGVILAGHGRRLAAIKLGRADAPVEVVSGMSEDEKKAYRLADNRVAIASYDSELLQQELLDIDLDMDGIFDKKELNFLEADMGELNEGAFVEDLDAAIEHQAEETVQALAEADEKPVAIAKALGFKTIPGKHERAVAMFMADIEEKTGKEGVEAFLAFVSARE